MTRFAVSGRCQLTQITQGQTSTDFAYDALGRRFSRTAGGTTTEFVYGAGGMALEKQGGSYTQAYTQANGLLRRGSEYPLFDGHGSERTVTNSSQTVTGSVNYEAFGQVAGSSGSSTSPYMYAGDWGYRNDGDAGLMHVGARYYDAQVGRFITRDTVLSEHPYLYCEHEPVGFVDPSGHLPGALALAAPLLPIPAVGEALIFAGGVYLVGCILLEGWHIWESRGKRPSIQPLPRPRPSEPRHWSPPERPRQDFSWWGRTPSPNDPKEAWRMYWLMKMYESMFGPSE